VHNDVGTTDARALLPLQSPGAEHEPPQSPGRREPRAVRSGPATGDGMSTKPWELQEQVRGLDLAFGRWRPRRVVTTSRAATCHIGRR